MTNEDAHNEGYRSCVRGHNLNENPYTEQFGQAWEEGFKQAAKDLYDRDRCEDDHK